MVNGQILKIHSDFYYVNFENEIYECKVREVLKKQKVKILVGDFVQCTDINSNKKTGVIEKILPRKNFLTRPSVANVEQVIIVSSIKEPDLDFGQLNRYIAFAKYHKIKTKLCFNKNDLSEDDSVIEKIFQIYEPLGFDIVFTSALEKLGIDDFVEILGHKTTVFAGNSGVGKSSLINAICPGLNIRTKEVSEKTSRGTHTTRHCEIITVDAKMQRGKEAEVSKDKRQNEKGVAQTPSPLAGEGWGEGYNSAPKKHPKTIKIIDTPGFSNVKFDFLMPNDVDEMFDEIKKYKSNCKFTDCLHIQEEGCSVLEHIDEIDISRYQSYLAFVEEAKDFKEKVKMQGTKKESTQKQLLDRDVVKISTRKRQGARNTQKQNMYKDLEEGD